VNEVSDDWGTIRAAGRDALTPRQRVAYNLHNKIVTALRAGDYQPSRIIGSYLNDPDQLRHAQADLQASRMQRNPEHFGGQGLRSVAEVQMIQNRPNAIQARVLMSALSGGTLDPHSGIVMNRYDTRSPQQVQQYEQLLDAYVQDLVDRRAQVERVGYAIKRHNQRDDVQRGDVRPTSMPSRVQAWNGATREGTLLQTDEREFAIHIGNRSYETMDVDPPDQMLPLVGKRVKLHANGRVEALNPSRGQGQSRRGPGEGIITR
jgi:hypothetical protein